MSAGDGLKMLATGVLVTPVLPDGVDGFDRLGEVMVCDFAWPRGSGRC